MRSARSRTWLGRLLARDIERAVSSSPAALAATSSSSVDLPTPGSPASSTTAPGTSPPPSTRSSSGTPVERAVACVPSTWPMGSAEVETRPGAVVRTRGRAAHLLDRAPRLALRAAAEPLGGLPAALGAAVGRDGPWRTIVRAAMTATVVGGADSAGAARGTKGRRRGGC